MSSPSSKAGITPPMTFQFFVQRHLATPRVIALDRFTLTVDHPLAGASSSTSGLHFTSLKSQLTKTVRRSKHFA
jgi:hypothetical protein